MTAPYPTDRDRAEQVAETSIGELIGNISNDLSTLFRQEVELAKAEVKQEASKAGKAAGMLGARRFRRLHDRACCSASRWCSASAT